MTAAERTLLLALFRWARADGGMEWGRWTHRWSRQTGEREQWLSIDFDRVDGAYLSIYRGRSNARDYWVADLAEAVDVLAALGIVPARFSTAYRAGWDGANRYAETAHYGAEWTAIRPHAKRELAVRR